MLVHVNEGHNGIVDAVVTQRVRYYPLVQTLWTLWECKYSYERRDCC